MTPEEIANALTLRECPGCGHMPSYHAWYRNNRCDGGGHCPCLMSMPDILAPTVAEMLADSELAAEKRVLTCVDAALDVCGVTNQDGTFVEVDAFREVLRGDA